MKISVTGVIKSKLRNQMTIKMLEQLNDCFALGEVAQICNFSL